MFAPFDMSRTETFFPAAWMLGKAGACACLLSLWHYQEWAPLGEPREPTAVALAAQHVLAALLALGVAAEAEADRLVAARCPSARRGGSTRVAADVLGGLLLLVCRCAPPRALCEQSTWAGAWATAWGVAAAAAAACEGTRSCAVRRECWGVVLVLAAMAATCPCAAHSVHASGSALLGGRTALYVCLICVRYYAAGKSAMPNLGVHGWVLLVSVRGGLAAGSAAVAVAVMAASRAAPRAAAAPLLSPRALAEAEGMATLPAASGAALCCLEEDFLRQMLAMEVDHAPPERERRRHGLFAA
jgi:hypothetical protein